jgi:HPt (histidine-containing phosphotransfer) domain-containing protein
MCIRNIIFKRLRSLITVQDTKSLVDVQFAIKQLGGNTDLLQRMLHKFSAEFSKVPQEINTLLAAGELKDAKMKVHTTKGLSGNLGMMALFASSKQLDEQMRDANIKQESVEQFADIMAKTIEFIKTIDIHPTEASTSSADNGSNEHKELFLKRLQGHEFIDDDTLNDYVDSLPMTDAQKSELITLVEDLHYDKVITIINSL